MASFITETPSSFFGSPASPEPQQSDALKNRKITPHKKHESLHRLGQNPTPISRSSRTTMHHPTTINTPHVSNTSSSKMLQHKNPSLSTTSGILGFSKPKRESISGSMKRTSQMPRPASSNSKWEKTLAIYNLCNERKMENKIELQKENNLSDMDNKELKIDRTRKNSFLKAYNKGSTVVQKTTVAFQHKKSYLYLNSSRLSNKNLSMNQSLKGDGQTAPEIEFRGFGLYKSFLRQNALEKIELKVNIPQTLTKDEDDNICMLFSEKNRLKKRKCTVEDFDRHIKTTTTQQLDHAMTYNKSKYKPYLDFREHSLTPYVLTRTASSVDPDNFFDKELLTYKAYSESRSVPNKNKLIQRYVFSRNLKAMIIRFVYHSKSSNENITVSNYAYRVQNVKPIFKTSQHRNVEISPTVYSATVVSYSQPDNFELSKLTGHSLKPYEDMSKSLVQFLEKLHLIRINKVVLDYMVDLNDNIWLVNIKLCELNKSVVMSRLCLDTELLTCTVYCKLCGVMYKRDQVSKNLTFKLLYELVEHLKKRTRAEDNQKSMLHNLKFNEKNNKPCQLCNICYMLVISEHELIEVEREMARTCNVKVKEQIVIEKVEPSNLKRPIYLAQGLYQWRLMLYFSAIEESEKCTDKCSNLYLQYRLNNLPNFGNCFQMPNLNKNSVPINQIKLHYFFSETNDIEKFLTETELKIRVTQGTDWHKYIGEGSSGTVSHFKNKMTIDTGQRHSSTILLFFDSCKYCKLYLTMGIVLDGTYNTKELNLYRQKDIYLPDPSYHNCNPLPREWIQMYEPNYALRAKDTEQGEEIGTYEDVSKLIGVKYLAHPPKN